jgi:hypothetical protein
MQNYLSEERRRSHRRDAMRDTLNSVFGDDVGFD